ncbi:MAG: hypothetical protein P8O70_20810 [SAR324 cluster bacterium]|nr:hypothetical protein [SAR324 cluster bacterium]
MKLFALIALVVLVSSCTSKIKSGNKLNGITYLDREDSQLSSCTELGEIVGIPNSLWGGAIGNNEARVDAFDRAKEMGATHFVETNANWTDGIVIGQAYTCK